MIRTSWEMHNHELVRVCRTNLFCVLCTRREPQFREERLPWEELKGNQNGSDGAPIPRRPVRMYYTKVAKARRVAI